MSKFSKVILTAIAIVLFSLNGYADSPLTSIEFYKAYLDVPIVKAAADKPNILSEGIMSYLYDDTNPLDVRMALINAVGWSEKGLTTYSDYIEYCLNHFPKDKERISPLGIVTVHDIYNNATPQQWAILVYLKAMANYTDMQSAYGLSEAAMQNPISTEAFMLPMALVWAQMKLLAGDIDDIYPSFQYLFGNAQVKDMRPKARKIIMDYIDLYYIDEAVPIYSPE